MKDKDIIELCLLKDEKAIDEIGNKYGSYLRTIAYNIISNNLDVEEIINDSYLIAWEKIPFDKPLNLKYYLAKIVRNLSFKRIEYLNAMKRNSELNVILSEIEDFVSDESSNVEKAILISEVTNVINSFLDTLSSIECSIFIARYYYFMSIKDISVKYNTSERKVKYCISKIKKKLRKIFEKEGYIK